VNRASRSKRAESWSPLVKKNDRKVQALLSASRFCELRSFSRAHDEGARRRPRESSVVSADVGRGRSPKNDDGAYRSFETRRVIIFATGKEEKTTLRLLSPKKSAF
jgi:hypothetical protein